MGHDHVNKSRRDVLKLFGVSTGLQLFQSPIQILIQSIVMGAFESAHAAANGISPRKYLHILQEGAPPRWTFDLFLTPYSTSGFVQGAQVGTAYNFANTGASLRYSTLEKAGLIVPHMWQYEVPSAAGGYRPMDPLLNNMVQLRGIEIGNPDHGAAQAMQFVPTGSIQSMTSLSADESNAPISAINLSLAQYRFVSQKSKSAITVSNGGDMLTKLLSPFISKSSGTFVSNKAKLGTALDTALSAMNSAQAAARPEVAGIATATEAAKDLMSKGFGDLATKWNVLVAKYRNLIRASLDPARSLPGMTDAAIVPAGTKKFQLGVRLPTSTTDLRTMIKTTTGISNLAEHFAVAEYVLTSNLSSSISIGSNGLYNLAFNGQNAGLGADEHETAGGMSTILNTYLNIAHAACLLELIDQLKAKGVYDETVIVMGGEFGRSATTTGFGSDHGYMGSSSTIYSGALKGNLVLGNIRNNGDKTGTWGQGAPVAQLGRALSVSDWASTVAYLLRVPSPASASPSLLVSASGGGYSSLIEKAKQV